MCKLKNLLIPIGFILTLSFISFVYLLNTTINEIDATSLQSERRILQSNFAELANTLSSVSENNGWWNAAFDNIITQRNDEWIRENIEEQNTRIEGVFIYGVEGDIVYSNMKKGMPRAETFLATGIEEILKALTLDDYVTPRTVSLSVNIENRIYLIGVSLVQKSTEIDDRKIQPERRPALLYVDEITEQDLSEFGERIIIKNLRLSYYQIDGQANMKVGVALNRKIYGSVDDLYLIWTPNTPGVDVLNSIMPLAICITLIIIFILSLFYRNAQNIVHDLNEANNAKSDFLANISHEIRTPLNAIIGFSDLIKLEIFGKIESEKYLEYLSFIQSSGLHLLSLINSILSLTKIEADKLEPFLEEIDTKSELNNCINILKVLVDKKKQILSSQLGEITIQSDRKIFQQVVLNVLSNAVKFTSNNGDILIKSYNSNKEMVIEIYDDGIGMDDEGIKISLSKFGQVQSSYTRNHEGVGLGLPLANQLIEALGGKMCISSSKGIGTIVSLHFPEVVTHRHSQSLLVPS